MSIDCSLEVLPTEETGKIIKKTKYGIWVQFGKVKIFMPFSDTFWDSEDIQVYKKEKK